jgi:hypothetical protein
MTEPLTRYEPGIRTIRGGVEADLFENGNGRCVKFADVEARDQAREAEIRALLAKWREMRDALHTWGDAARTLQHCSDVLESLLTPASQEGTTR